MFSGNDLLMHLLAREQIHTFLKMCIFSFRNFAKKEKPTAWLLPFGLSIILSKSDVGTTGKTQPAVDTVHVSVYMHIKGGWGSTAHVWQKCA